MKKKVHVSVLILVSVKEADPLKMEVPFQHAMQHDVALMKEAYSVFMCTVHLKCFTIKPGGLSSQPLPVCSIHLDDVTAATLQWRKCAHLTPAIGGEKSE